MSRNEIGAGPMQYFSVAMAGDASADGGQQAVMVPAYSGTVAPAGRDRVRLLRKRLVEVMRGAREARPAEPTAAVDAPEPSGFSGSIARTACTLCRGWCCRNGGEHAYLDEASITRVRQARPGLDARSILRLYTQSVADPAYAGSCIFHGAQGCTLDRGLRSNICNSYFCNGLDAVVKSEAPLGNVIVISAEGTEFRMSPVLNPDSKA